MEIKLLHGDITQLTVDAVVNAAKNSLLGGSGVDGAIHKAGGPSILRECKEINAEQGGCPTGEAVITTAGKLPAKYVIHTVGPVYQNGQNGEPDLLRNCYLNSLKLASGHQLESIAFPNISTGAYGYPKGEAAKIAVDAVRSAEAKTLHTCYFVCFDDENYRHYQKLLG